MKKFEDLQNFIKFLQSNGELKVIDEEVSTKLEITEISKRFLEDNGPALLFTNIINSQIGLKSEYNLLSNLFTSEKRIAMALGTETSKLKDLGELLAFLKHPEPPSSFKEAWSMLPMAQKILSMKPKIVSSAPCQEIIEDDVNLYNLPIQYCWPGDAGYLITWGVVVTKGPSDEKIDNFNLGIYRMQVIAKDKVIMRWLKLRGGAEHFKRWSQEKKESFKLSVFIGADPSIIISAVMPIPENMSEYNFAGLLKGERIKLVKSISNDILVPASAEFILEGEIDFDEIHEEGPFGDHTGYYNEVENFPIFKINKITRRKTPIYLTTYTGKPPDEPAILGKALNEIFVPIVKKQFPEIVDFWLPPEGCSYRVAVVSIKKSYPGHARRIMMGVWSYLRQFSYTKFVIVVDDDINVRCWKDVIWAISTRTDPARDVSIIENTPIDYLDFVSPESGLGSKMGIDATKKLFPETKRLWPDVIKMNEDIIEKMGKIYDKIK